MLFSSRPFWRLGWIWFGLSALLSFAASPGAHSDEFGLAPDAGFMEYMDRGGRAPAGPRKGDVYFLWGDLSKRWTHDEYGKVYGLVTWLASQGYRAVVNPVAYEADIRDAVSRAGVVGVIWSSHGSKDGAIYDSADHPVARDTFSRGAKRSFRHLVLGNCYGQASAEEYYRLPSGVTPHAWPGEATTTGFFRYLNSERWRKDFLTDLR
jgi:hypothetical protein